MLFGYGAARVVRRPVRYAIACAIGYCALLVSWLAPFGSENTLSTLYTVYMVAIIPPFVFGILAVYEGSYILFERMVTMLIR